MIDKVVARNDAEYSIFRANARMTAAVNGQINSMREKVGLPPMATPPASTRNIVVAHNLAEAGIYRLNKALDDSALLVNRFEQEMGRIIDTVA